MQQSRDQVKALRLAVRHGDADAARLLLAHSAALRHDRLGVRRYFIARALGVADLDYFRPFGQAAARRMSPDLLLAAARDATRNLGRDSEIHLMASELFPSAEPLVLPFDGTWPRLATEPRLCGAGASVLGKVQIGARASLGPGTVIRADGHFVRIGDDFRLGEMSTVHIAHEIYPAIIGDRVAVGRDAVVHACTVGDDCVIEDGVVVLDGSIIENGVLIEARSTVFPRSTLKSGLVYSGSPAKPIREVMTGEIEKRALLLHDAVAASLFATMADDAGESSNFPADVFVARTARLAGKIDLGARSSVLFGCQFDAGGASIAVGENSNIQDNTRIDASEGGVVVGPNTTIGHNVYLRACRIGEHALVGIGSDLGTGTTVDDDVLLAAGSTTTPGQHLESGWLWGGRPARPIARLDDTRRAAMREIIGQYRAYGAAYRLAQDRPAEQGGSNGTSAIANRHPNR